MKPPAPFKLIEKEGETMLELTRDFGKDEKVIIKFVANDQEEHEMTPEDEEEVAENGLFFTVDITKPDSKKSLTLECVTNGDIVEIRGVTLGTSGEEDTESFEYTGPDYHELDEKLQESFEGFLEARGVGPELTAFMINLSSDKEQRLYMEWLAGMSQFVHK